MSSQKARWKSHSCFTTTWRSTQQGINTKDQMNIIHIINILHQLELDV